MKLVDVGSELQKTDYSKRFTVRSGLSLGFFATARLHRTLEGPWAFRRDPVEHAFLVSRLCRTDGQQQVYFLPLAFSTLQS
jgi:hypothetical protein